MGNLKKFLSNKNTVTVLGVLVGVVFLYIAYNMRVNQAVKPVSVPIAKEAISSSSRITQDMIEYVDVTSDFIKKSPNLVTNASQIINSRVIAGASIPQNGFFYTDQVTNSENSSNSIVSNIPDGYTIFELKVDMHKTYGNSIYPGNYIDIYMKADNGNGLLIYEKLIESIKVLDVRDSSGNSVFNGSEEKSEPEVLLFAVPDELHLLLNKAKLINGAGIDLFPVPRNASYSKNPKETSIANESLVGFINARSQYISED